jgi:Tol biopolymer transport system component
MSFTPISTFFIRKTLLLLGLIMLGTAFSMVQPAALEAQQRPQFLSYPQNHLDWYTVSSDHFLVHFQEGNDRPARVISRISEEVWGEVTELYDYEPDVPISIVLIDREDYANGAAYFFDNKIEIWLPSLNTPFRGTNNWLRDVITHEFTHIVQIQASMNRSRRFPITYLQWLSYEDVRRPDVLYGYPSGIITFPIPSVSVPAWFAEGTAQFNRQHLHYDYWDTHRDMMLRSNVLADKLPGLVEMGHFSSKTSIEREMAYNHGFSLTQYMANRFGEQSIAGITKELQNTSDIRTAIRRQTGVEGEQIYRDWADSLRTAYEAYSVKINPFPAERIHDIGFLNIEPSFTPDGKIAFLSSMYFDFARTQLVIKDDDGDATSVLDAGDVGQTPSGGGEGNFRHSCGMNSTPLISRIGNGYSFSPDGNRIAYNKIEKNKYGETYNDIYIFDRETEESHQITESARISDPVYSPDGEQLLALAYDDGTLNLVLMDPETGEYERLTNFGQSQQLYRPMWSPDGQTIYVAMAAQKGRNIISIPVDAPDDWEIMFMHPTRDYRDPFISPDGQHMYFSADINGKFDVYRYDLETPGRGVEQLTDVIGGAFMPKVNADGELLYSEYTAEGYKIRRARVEDLLNHAEEHQLAMRESLPSDPQPSYELDDHPLNRFDDMDVEPFDSDIYAIADTSSYAFELSTRGQDDTRQFSAYEDTFIDFSFLPTVRFDNYSQEFGSNGSLLTAGNFGDLGRNLLRDVKFGFYATSREVLDRLSLFGGALVGFGSRDADTVNDFFSPGRLIDLDRDLFLIAQYRGLPFIERYWSPTIELGFYNLRRNVANGLEVEEFPCTACLPENKLVDIAYDIWQAEVNIYSKLNRFSLIELGYRHSPYRVSTDSFFSDEFNDFVPGSTSRYFIGNTLTAAYIVDAYLPYRHGDIAPLGFRGDVRYSFEPSRLLDNYEIRDGTLVPVYNNFQNHSVELDARYGFMGPFNKVFQFRTRLFSYFDDPDEYFFLDYIGGFDGMRSYPFFALGGNRTAFAQLSYHQPIKTNINRQSGPFILDKIYARFFAEAGNGWGGPLEIGNNIKSGIGAELRVAVNSFYLFPTRFFVSGAYGLNRFDLSIPEGFVSAEERDNVQFGGELLFNFGLLFDFEL